MVLFSLKYSIGGEIFVPKIPSYKIMELAKSIGKSSKFKIIGIRQGEKIHEEMITKSDSFSTIDIGKYYIILPANKKNYLNYYRKNFNLKSVPRGFSYSSGTNKTFLTINEIRTLIKKHININFKPL